MSRLRDPGGRRKAVAIASAIGLLVALIGGFVLGRASVGEPEAQDVVERLRGQLRPVAADLERLPAQYEQAQAGTGAAAARTDASVERVQAGVRAALGDLAVLDPDGADELEGAVGSLAGAVSGDAPPAQVEQLTAAARSALARVPGGK